MKPKNIARRLILVLLVVAMMVPLITSVGAYPWNGSGTGGGNATGTAGGDTSYSIAGGNATEMIVGYRFTGLTANGQRANGARSLDVFVTGKEWFLTEGLYQRMVEQYNKYEYVRAFEGKLVINNGTTTDQYGAVLESTMKFASRLPSSLNTGSGQIDDKLKTWQQNHIGNLDLVAKKIGYKDGTDSMGPNDKIIVEPIFALRVDGVNFCMTASDIAWLGYSEIFDYNKDSNGRKSGMNGKKGTWYYISNYTNLYCPNILFTDKEDGVGGLWKICPSTGLGSTHGTFETLLTYGYGVGLCYNNKVTKPDLEAVDIICEVKSGSSWIRVDPKNIPCSAKYRITLVYRNNRTNSSASSSIDDVVLWFGDNTSGSTALDANKMTPFTTAYNTSGGTWWYANAKYTYSQDGRLNAKTELARTGFDQKIYWTKSGGNRDFTAPSSAGSGSWQIAIWMHVPYGNFADGDPTNHDWDYVSKRQEENVANNRYQVNYQFTPGGTSHDVAITGIRYYDKPYENGGKEFRKDANDRYIIPYGATVYVYHDYKNNSGMNLWINGYEGTTNRGVLYNGETDIYIDSYSTKKNVFAGSFTANSFTFVSRSGYVYVSGSGKSASAESNQDNNVMSVEWKAYVDLELEKIELCSTTNPNVILDPNNIPYGSSFAVYYTFKNNSALAVANAATYKKNDFTGSLGTHYIAEKGATDEEGNNISKIRIKGDTLSNVTSSGTVSGSICVSGNTSLSYELSETRANNKKSLSYKVVAQKDLEVEFIQYAYNYTNSAGATETVTQTVYRGTDVAYETKKLPVFPYGVVVYVYAQFANNSGVQVVTDGYYTRGTGSQTAMTYAPTLGGVKYDSATNYDFPANSSQKFCVGLFNANVFGDSKYTVEVYLNDKKSATGETNEYNNSQTSNYRVYGDVGIEIYFTDKNNNIVDPAVFWQGAEYKVWLKVTNYTPFAQNVGVYYNGEIVGYDLNDNGAIDTTILNLGASGNTHAIYSFVVDTLTGSELEKALGHYSVKAEVYFYGSTTATGECDVNGNDKTANNTATKNYTIIAEVGITNIIYKDEDGNILNTSGILEGTKVKVYFVCTNDATVDIAVELLYNGENFADGTILPAKTTGTEIYITEFIAEDPSQTHKDIGEVYRLVSGISQPADGEENEDNNIKLSFYNVIFYDVAITDIFYQDADGNFYGRGNNDDVSLVVGKPYKVYYTLKNFSDEVVLTHVYTQKDPFATGATRITGRILRTPDGTTIDARNGLELSEFESISVHVGTILAANQEIGTGAVGGYIYICDAGFGYNDVPNTDIERNAANNALGEKIIFKHNVSIEEVYLTPLGSNQRFPVNSSDPSFVDIPVGTTANVHYVLKNHTGKTIKVNIYAGSTPKMQTVNHGNYVITLNPMETKEVVLDKTLTLNATGRRMLVGSVYRDGYSPNTDPYEMTFSDNTTNCYYNGVVTPYITPIKPNAPYREGTDVITSYYLFNPTNKAYNGHPGATAEVRLTVKLKGTTKVIYEENKFTVIPASCSTVDRAQLVYFKWSVPEDYLKDTDKFEVCADLVIPQYPDIGISYVSYSQDYINKDARFTPDTKYEASEPDGWTKPSSPDVSYSETKEWYTWTYNNGTFTRNRYGIEANGGYTGIMPTSVTAFNQRGQYYMKSGYGVEIGYSTGYYMNYPSTPGGSYSTLLADMYTVPQYAYMIWPEFQYSEEDGCISTLEWVASAPEGDRWKLYEFMDYGRVHWTPIWFPDGDYIAYACYSDLWTPMGMITVCSQSNKIIIDGNMYDDWYIGHG